MRDPARAEQARENARQPRITIDDDVRAELKEAKGKLARALTSDGVRWLIDILHTGPARWEFVPREGGGHPERILLSGSEDFTWAMNFAADRAGMPRRTEADLVTPGGFTIVVDGGGLDWPAALGGGDRDRTDGSPDVAQ